MATQAGSQGKVATESKAQEKVELTVLDREVGAAFIASGFGSFVLGLTIIFTEMKSGAGLSKFLTFITPVGPLSGKTTVAVIAFIVSWVGLHFYFKNRGITLTRAFTISIVLLALGLLMSFPPFFDLFAH